MSYQPPPAPPSGDMPPAPMPSQPPAPRPSGFFGQFRGMPWWQVALIVLPLSLIAIGGLIGGVLGALAAVGNTYVARSSLPVAAKVAVMVGVLVASYVVWFIVALAIALALHPGASS